VIIVKYLVKEALKTQVAILFILFLIFFCQKLVKILSAAVEGDVPTSLVLSLLGLGVPEMAQLILPLSLFLGILMAYSKLYAESEITVMHACGIGKKTLLNSALLLSVLTGALAAANVIWLSPWSQVHQNQVLAEAKANPGLAALVEGQFQKNSDGNMVLFVGNVSGNRFTSVFMAQVHPTGNQRPSVVVADSGHIVQDPNGNQVVYLDKGSRYEGTTSLKDFRITDFTGYQAVIGHQETQTRSDDEEQATIPELIASDSSKSKAELNWRLTLIFSVPLMALLVVPLSVVNPRQGRVMSMLPAMLLYLIYFLLQSSLKSNGAKGKLDPMVWMWAVNAGYFVLALALNLWDSIPFRRLRYSLRRKV
jgi:lipopolysaccharide export system permease protein